jgi:acyl-[acyl-carrier-protein]-phospholipid O-acyltransferase/long-chain-fatty-acid--[acyl-carrier-protein] ligase
MNHPLEPLLRWLGGRLVRCFYKLRVLDSGAIPEGGCLLLPNHLSWGDAILLQVATPRRIRFLVDDAIYKRRALRPLFHLIGALPIFETGAKETIRTTAEALRRGEMVCIFSEREISRSGSLLRIRDGFELLAREAGTPVLPVWLDEVWGSILSPSGGRYFFKWLGRRQDPVTIAFGEPLHPSRADAGVVREHLMELGERCFQTRPALKGHLGRAAVDALARDPNSEMLVDGMDGSRLSRGMLLAAGLALAKRLRQTCPEPRIAIVLPSGKGATLANLAVVLAGKVPVNLNFTAARQSLEAACRIAGLQTAITARAFESKVPEFPWPPAVVYLEDLVPQVRTHAILWRGAIQCLPGAMIARLAQVSSTGDRAEAVTLFTSGSSGDPKGVVLSHRNLLGNVRQFSHMIGLKRGESILSCLPVFHSFGSTVNLWFPILEGLRMVTYPSPLDIPKNAELIERYNVRMLCSTPTFLRGYLRKAEPKQLRSLELVITGAEKLPADVAEAFEARFGKEVLQGYGLTETSPVTSVNLPDPPLPWPGCPVESSNRKGAVGKLLPGMSAQIRDPESGEKLSLHDTGMLWLKGVNIFEGYLHDPLRTADAIQDGWLRTGDLGRFDADGFLFIEGRLSRFSKIGGEMIPHETVEAGVASALEISGEERTIAITGIPDEAKGEALVLLSSLEVDLAELRNRLVAVGFPNLWIPRRWVRVSEIPHLASGKLDIQKIQKLAMPSERVTKQG